MTENVCLLRYLLLFSLPSLIPLSISFFLDLSLHLFLPLSSTLLYTYTGRDPQALQLLTKLYIERAHSLWKEPEVINYMYVYMYGYLIYMLTFSF